MNCVSCYVNDRGLQSAIATYQGSSYCGSCLRQAVLVDALANAIVDPVKEEVPVQVPGGQHQQPAPAKSSEEKSEPSTRKRPRAGDPLKK